MNKIIAVVAFALAALPVFAADLFAQSALAQQQLGRPYWHVFIAYALLWIILGGWLFHIVRRLKQVEERLGTDGD